MVRPLWHGILIDQAFTDRAFPESFNSFAKEGTSSLGWLLYGVIIAHEELAPSIKNIQDAMRSDKVFYSHLYNDQELIVIFKERIFRVGSHESTWEPILEFGRQSGISEEQLDFWPNRFQDERHYFQKESFSEVGD